MSVSGKDKIKELAVLYYAPLLRYAASLARDESLARDAVQESFLKLMNEPREIEYPKAWLFTVCRNKIFNELHRSKKFADPGEGPDSVFEKEPDCGRAPDKSAELNDGVERVKMITRKLGAREREIVRLRFQCGFSYSEIAEITSLSKTNVGVILHNAMNSLREMFFSETGKQLNQY